MKNKPSNLIRLGGFLCYLIWNVGNVISKKTKFKNFLINLFGFIWFELYNIYENNKSKNMRKKFTKSQFEAVKNEIFRLAKEFTKKGYTSLVTMVDEDHITLYVNREKCLCDLDVRIKRYANADSVEELIKLVKTNNIQLGKYVQTIIDAYYNDHRKHYLFDF